MPSASAQDPPPDFETGLKPYGSLFGADVDTVSLSQGGLSVHAPLLGYPQRGALRLDFDIFYFNYTYGYIAHCMRDGTCTDQFVYQGMRNTYVDDTQTMALESGRHCEIPQFPSGYYTVPNNTVHTSDGANHPIGDTGLGWWYTVDATGIRTVLTSNAASEISITDQTGVTYYPASSTAPAKKEDANGNQITLNTASWTDTVGRTIPFPPNDIYGNKWPIAYPNHSSGVATDTSGCVGPLTPARAALWQVPAPGAPGTTASLKFCFANAPQNFRLYLPDNGTYQQVNGPLEMIQSILLPNGQSWIFEYNDNFADLTKITFPTGGTIAYTWGDVEIGETMWSRQVLTRTVNAMDGTGAHTWTYTYGGTPYAGPFPFTNTVTDPLGNYTNHVFSRIWAPSGNGGSVYETQTATYDKSSGTAVLLKTVNTDYQSTNPTSGTGDCLQSAVNTVPIRVTTIWPNGQQTKVESDYDMGFTFKDMKPGSTATNQGSYGKVINKRDYDYGSGAPGALLRTTSTAYLALANSNYLTIDGVGMPTSVTTYDGSGTQRAQTTYGYDENNGSPQGTFGNQTSATQWLNGGTSPRSQTVFNAQGMLAQKVDPLGNTTIVTYDSTGLFLSQIQHPTTSGIAHIEQFSYDATTGVLNSHTDQNGRTTSYQYDSIRRPTQVTYPDGGQTTYCYTDMGGATCTQSAPPLKVVSTRLASPSPNLLSTTVFDGAGRISQTQINSDPDCGSGDKTDTTYDALGRVASVSNPYCTTSDPTYGLATYTYDALGRVNQVTQPEGGAVGTSYSGNCTTVTDEASKKRQSCSDGLGRLTQVTEDPGGRGYITNYTYDTLDNLLTVVQNGSRQRTFAYDSLSRLTSAT